MLLLLFTSILTASILCEVYLFIYAYKRRHMAGAKYFMYLLVTMIIYNGGYIGELNARSLTEAVVWYKIEHIGSCIQIYFWLMMCVDYVRLEKKFAVSFQYIMLLQPLIFYVGFFTNDRLHLYTKRLDYVYNGHFMVLIAEKGPYYNVMLQLISHLAFITVIIYIRGICTAPKSQRTGYFIMMVASFFPWFSGYFTASDYNVLNIDYYPICTLFSCLLLVLGIFRYNFFETIPIAMEMVYRQSGDGIMLIDNNERIIDANNKMKQLYPELDKISRGISVNTFIHKYPEYKQIVSKNQFDFLYCNNSSSIYFRADIKPIITKNFVIGKIVKIIDISEIVEQKSLLQQVALIAIDKAEMNEISFLQAQINPHFINNTLSIVASMITRAPNEAKKLITELGEYLSNCYYFDSESPMVPLKKELQTVWTYVNIKQARFGERVKFELIADHIPEIDIPRLILQPLVENAIRHGILKKVEGGKVYLIIKNWNNKLFIDVRDSGVGIAEEYINDLNSAGNDKKGIGLSNINRRLIKYYQEGLTIKRTEIGTSVSFWIPIENESANRGGQR